MRVLIPSLTFLVLFSTLSAAAVPPPTDDEILKLVQANLEAAEAGDVDGMLATCHSESLSRADAEQMVAHLDAYELDYHVEAVEFIAMSGEYALVRLTQHTRRISGPDFLDNELESVWSLRQEDGEWKFWSQMVLRIGPLGRDGEPD